MSDKVIHGLTVGILVFMVGPSLGREVQKNAAFYGGCHDFNVESGALSVSRDGRYVVGWIYLIDEDETRAVRWREEGGFEFLGDLEGGPVYGEAWDASGDGSKIVGLSYSDIGSQPFLWTAEEGMQVVGGGLLNVPCGAARGVSHDGGVIIGQLGNCGNCGDQGIAYRYSNEDGFTYIGLAVPGFRKIISSHALSVSGDGSVVVGYASGHVFTEAFRWTPETGSMGLGDLPGGQFHSVANAVSGDGRVVVGTGWSDRGLEAFRWTEETGMTPLGTYPEGVGQTEALAVCADGSVILGTADTDQGARAIIWREGDRDVRFLDDVLKKEYELNLEGWTLRAATGICDEGRVIAGHGVNPDGKADMWVASLWRSPASPVPCSAIHQFQVQCKDGDALIRITSDLPNRSVLTLVIREHEGDAETRTQEIYLNESGRGRTRIRALKGRYDLSLLECPDFSIEAFDCRPR